jgi:rSAM/selenodomain-associated transferase 2
MRLSIIVPILNEGAQAEACVRRLAPLRAAGHELILVDGGSDELLVDRLEPQVDRLLQGEAGRARQMNLGARAAMGEVFWFLHADTWPIDDAVAAIQAANLSQPAWGRFDVRLDGRAGLLRLVERMMNGRSRWSGIATGDQGIFVHRELFRQVGGFPDQPLMEDIEISARLKRLRRPVCLPQQLLTSSRRWQQQGILRTIVLMWGLRLAYWLGVSPERLAGYYNLKPWVHDGT